MAILKIEGKLKCSAEGCAAEALWIPHLHIDPPEGIPGKALVLSVDAPMCDDHKMETKLSDLVDDKEWELLKNIFVFRGEDGIVPLDREKAKLVFHTIDEVNAYLERGSQNESMQ